MPISGTFAGRLAALRERSGLSKSGLARAVGVSTTCVWNWEEGNTHPRMDALARCAAALKTSAAFLERGIEPTDGRDQTDAVEAMETPLDLDDLIRDARIKIAAAARLPLDRVKVVLEYGT